MGTPLDLINRLPLAGAKPIRPRRLLVPWLFPAPALAVLVSVLAFPTVYNLYLSLFDWYIAQPPQFIGLGNYVEMFLRDRRFWTALGHTVHFSGITIPAELILGTAVALLFRERVPGNHLLRVLFILPMVATPAAVALVWAMLLTPTGGMLNYLLQVFGLGPSLWATHPRTVIPSLALVDIWQWTPMVTLIVLAGLESLPEEPYEAARIDGATFLQTFFRITVPLLRPSLVVAMLFRTIDSLKTFDIIYVITQGGPGTASETLNVYLYQKGFNYLHFGYASALGMVLLGCVFGFSLCLSRLREREWSY